MKTIARFVTLTVLSVLISIAVGVLSGCSSKPIQQCSYRDVTQFGNNGEVSLTIARCTEASEKWLEMRDLKLEE
jgi:hypothetical protein